jgi:hypothetical protein
VTVSGLEAFFNRRGSVNREGEMATKKKTDEKTGSKLCVNINAPNMQTATIRIRGDAPMVQNAFGVSAIAAMRYAMEHPEKKKRGKGNREPKNFKLLYEESKHVSTEGWLGIPAAGLRGAMIRACSLVNYKMTMAKMAVFIHADGFDAVSGMPLIKITKGEPKYVEHVAPNANGAPDIRARPMFDPGWEANVRIRYDTDQFSAEDISNLLMRVGFQVGVGAGRPCSVNSPGCGWGTFEVAD